MQKSAGPNALCRAVLRITASRGRRKTFSLQYYPLGAVLVQEAAALGLSRAPSCPVRSAVQYASSPVHHYTKREKSRTLMASFHKPNSGSDPASVAFLNKVDFIPTQKW